MNPLPEPIAVQLRRLRRRLSLWLVIDGLCRLLLGLMAFVAVDFLLDWSFQMDRPQRSVMLGLMLAAVLAVIYRRLWRPLAARPGDGALALEIERRHPDLREGLIAAVQFSQQPAHAGVSTAMRQAAIDNGARAAAQIEFPGVLNRRRFQTNALSIAAALAVIAGSAAAWGRTTLSIWFDRNVLLGEQEWPQDIHFEFVGAVDGQLVAPRGDDWPLDVLVTEDSRRQPSELWLETRGSGRRQKLKRLDDGRHFQGLLAGLNDALEVRVVESRAFSPWVTVRLTDRPAVASLQLTLIPPAYTSAKPETLAPGGGPYRVLQGSRLSIRGSADKPLSAATLHHNKLAHPLQQPADREFAGDLSAADLHSGDYAIDVLDRDLVYHPATRDWGPLASREPATFRLTVVPDRPPQVHAKVNGVGSLVTPRAMIPLSGRMTDDFGVADARLRRRWRAERDEADTTGILPLGSSLALPAAACDLQLTLDLEPLQPPPGVSMSFYIEADDNNTESGPGQGRSTVFLVRVVTEEEFRGMLLAREREHGGVLQQNTKLEDELLTDNRALAAAIRGRADLSDDERTQLNRLQKRQKTIRDELARLAGRFDDLTAEIRNNRLEDEGGPLQRRLTDQILRPLRDVLGGELEQAIADLETAARTDAAADIRDQAVGHAAQQQELALAQLREILTRLEQAEGFQEAVNAMLEVLKAQQDVLRRTEQEKQDAIRKLLDSDVPPDGQ